MKRFKIRSKVCRVQNFAKYHESDPSIVSNFEHAIHTNILIAASNWNYQVTWPIKSPFHVYGIPKLPWPRPNTRKIYRKVQFHYRWNSSNLCRHGEHYRWSHRQYYTDHEGCWVWAFFSSYLTSNNLRVGFSHPVYYEVGTTFSFDEWLLLKLFNIRTEKNSLKKWLKKLFTFQTVTPASAGDTLV